MLVIHATNRHLDLIPVIAAAGEADGLIALLKEDHKGEAMSASFKAASSVVALVHDPADFGGLAAQAGWRRLHATDGIPAWTDDYSNVFGALIRRKIGF
jgi:hypothetical protein